MNRFFGILFGNTGDFSFENRVFNAIAFITVLQCVITFFWNLSLGMPIYIISTISVIGLICAVFYYYSRFRKKFNALSYLILACILLSVVWFLNEGSKGATSFSFLFTAVGIICISNKKHHFIFLSIILLNIALLFFLEKNFYETFMHGHHTAEEIQSDMVFFFILDLILIYFIVSFLKENYDKENKTIEAQKELLNRQHTKITDSIKSAELIQGAMLPNELYLNTLFNDYFVYYKPKDIVSGDFYWVNSYNDTTFFVAADCTGHGVSGALMSMLGIAFLNEITAKNPDIKPNEVLDELRKKVISALNQPQTKTTLSYGMDISVCALNRKTGILHFSGANNALYLIRNKQLIEYKADKMPIGTYPREQAFSLQTISVEENDVFYIFSDGFEDQFGMNKKKFSKKNFRAFLLDNHETEMKQQPIYFENHLNQWKGNEEQTDDILVIGIKI